MKGQSSLEFLGVAMIGLLFFSVLFFIAFDFIGERSFDTAVGQARLSSSSLVDAANAICLQPVGSKTETIVPIPSFINSTASSVANRSVTLVLQKEDRIEYVVATSACTLNGSLPERGGTYIFEVEREAAAVNVTVK